jgi:hypothetical protein
MTRRSFLPICLVLALAAEALPQPARADGDPASDVLIVQNVFLPFQVNLPPPIQQGLFNATAQAKRVGYPIKVALIIDRFYLGRVPSLWLKPQTYARFLGQELNFVYRGRLLVVMPNGFGVYHGRASVAPEQRVLRGVRVGEGPGGLAASALDAVVKLAAAAGHRLDVPQVTLAVQPQHSPANRNRLLIGGAVLGAVLAAGFVVFVRWRRGVRRGCA